MLTSVSPLRSTRWSFTFLVRKILRTAQKYCLKRTADDNKIFSEKAVKSVQEDFYNDDLLRP